MNSLIYSVELVANARKRLQDLTRSLDVYSDSKPYEFFVHDDPKTKYSTIKARLLQPIPVDARIAARDVLKDLRSALDQAAYASALSRNNDPKRTYFPFAKTKKLFAELGKSRNDIPSEIFAVMQSFRAYDDEDGNRVLYALANSRNLLEHCHLRPFGTVATTKSSMLIKPENLIELSKSDEKDFLLEPQTCFPPDWNPDTQEITFVTFDSRLSSDFDFSAVPFLVFDMPNRLQYQKPVETLHLLLGMVELALAAIEQAGVRLGVFQKAYISTVAAKGGSKFFLYK